MQPTNMEPPSLATPASLQQAGGTCPAGAFSEPLASSAFRNLNSQARGPHSLGGGSTPRDEQREQFHRATLQREVPICHAGNDGGTDMGQWRQTGENASRRVHAAGGLAHSSAPSAKEELHQEAARMAVHPVTGLQIPLKPEHFDNAVAAYGVQLRTWIEIQVESCLSKLLHGLDSETITLRQEVLSVMGVCEQMDGQVLTLSESQVDMDRRLESVLEESAKLKAALASCQENVHAMLESHGSNLALHVTELHKKQEQHASHMSEFQHHHREYADAFQRHSHNISEISGGLCGLQSQLEKHANKVQQLETESTSRHEAFISECAEKIRVLEDAHQKHVTNAQETLTSFEQQVSNIPVEWNARLETLVSQDVVQHLMEDSRRDLNRRIDELQACMLEDVKTRVTAKDLVLMQQELLARMRAELTAAFRSEAEAVSALDEQLLFKDQLLRQRLDQAESLKARERIAVIERGGNSQVVPAQNSQTSPTEGNTAIACLGDDYQVGNKMVPSGGLHSGGNTVTIKSERSAVTFDEDIRNRAPHGVQLPLFSEHYIKTLHSDKLREHAMLLQRVLGPEGRAAY